LRKRVEHGLEIAAVELLGKTKLSIFVLTAELGTLKTEISEMILN
jgi:hypothetical protein